MIQHIMKLIWRKKGANSLILLEILLSFVVLFGVLSFALYNLERVQQPIGFEVEDKWILHLDRTLVKDSARLVTLLPELKQAITDLPNFNQASWAELGLPYSGGTWNAKESTDGVSVSARVAIVDEDFPLASKLKLTEGRWFNEDDLLQKEIPMVVNKHFLDLHYPGVNMIDSIIEFQGDRKIIGSVLDYRYGGAYEEELSTVFAPFRAENCRFMPSLLIDVKPNTPMQYEEELGEVIKSIAKTDTYVIEHVNQSKEFEEKKTWFPLLILLSICGFLCINVALGLLGVLWYNINKRRSEIGLRRAIGAHTSDIAKQFVLEILFLAAVAVGIGTLFAVQIPLLQIIDIERTILIKSIVLAALIIFGIVTLCALYPSNQAARIQPALALHED